MCKASEIHCRDSSCCRPIGWFVVQPCTPFLKANKGMPPAFDGSRDLNWNTSTSDCGVPRVVSTKKSTCRTCQPCFWKALCSNFALVQDWAYVAKTHRKWLAENPGDGLLWRRTKARLRREYDQSHSQGKKRKLADESFEMLTPPLSRQSSQPETSPNTSIYASTADNLGWYPTPPENCIDPECLGPSVLSINPPGPTAASPGGQD
ncbi:hypothetical protein BBK36DRAFT_5915 [Trichoderma citrinoviride]|uniref:Uncharacterized protein n=1 Tax=Trichoderma citrinoviride TaxID=58853 RepID=A0A2T4B817_9HYPO|nr:hypothetical protein BBK36DRAFT_5915 [Trichoderma citrinoviride]PTB65473.1 hypothetical protein BBK36DRAFT_5915 [Trichoderma citrinoviride]